MSTLKFAQCTFLEFRTEKRQNALQKDHICLSTKIRTKVFSALLQAMDSFPVFMCFCFIFHKCSLTLLNIRFALVVTGNNICKNLSNKDITLSSML